jgi:excisionase family DNA binding protein
MKPRQLKAASPSVPDASALDLSCRLALRPAEAAEALGISERTLRALLPELPHVRTGGVVLLPVDGLRRWLDEKTKAGEGRADAVARELLEGLGT